jgi:hypothetical protein
MAPSLVAFYDCTSLLPTFSSSCSSLFQGKKESKTEIKHLFCWTKIGHAIFVMPCNAM